jgi:hypothetical protein
MRVSSGRGVIREYQKLSPEDQRTFEKWLKANTVFAAILAVGMLAMALAGNNSVGPNAEIAAVVTPLGH